MSSRSIATEKKQKSLATEKTQDSLVTEKKQDSLVTETEQNSLATDGEGDTSKTYSDKSPLVINSAVQFVDIHVHKPDGYSYFSFNNLLLTDVGETILLDIPSIGNN